MRGKMICRYCGQPIARYVTHLSRMVQESTLVTKEHHLHADCAWACFDAVMGPLSTIEQPKAKQWTSSDKPVVNYE